MLFAYIPPILATSKPILLDSLFLVTFITLPSLFTFTVFCPVTICRFLAHNSPFTLTASAKISVLAVLDVLRPWESICIVP